MAEAAADMTDAGGGKIDNAPGHAAAIHQLTGEEKEADGEEQKTVDSRQEELRDDFKRNAWAVDEQRRGRGDEDGEDQVDAHESSNHHHADKDEDFHQSVSPPSRKKARYSIATAQMAPPTTAAAKYQVLDRSSVV